MAYFHYILFGLESACHLLRNFAPWIWPLIDWVLLSLVDVFRLKAGGICASNLGASERPKEPLLLYEYEGCPYCRKVRETLSCLNIDYYCYPCPRETLTGHGQCLNSRWRPEVQKEGGTAMFPFLIDPNTKSKMYQSDDIIKYLWQTYGKGAKQPLNYQIAFMPLWKNASLRLAAFCRPCLDMGMLRAPSRNAAKPLELWGMESSAATRRTKEVLSTLELPYLFHVLPVGATEKRTQYEKEFGEATGFLDVRPRLKDPNGDGEPKLISGSRRITAYLKEKYQTAPIPGESWLDWSPH